MEHGSLGFKIVLDDGPEMEVPGRLASRDLAGAAYTAAVLKYHDRNIDLGQRARIIKRHLGELQPELPPDPDAPGPLVKKLVFFGFVEAATEIAVIERAVVLFGIGDTKRNRLAVIHGGSASGHVCVLMRDRCGGGS
jgi:hypothetical protein